MEPYPIDCCDDEADSELYYGLVLNFHIAQATIDTHESSNKRKGSRKRQGVKELSDGRAFSRWCW